MKDAIGVQHGKLFVNVPRKVFRDDGTLDPDESRYFRGLMASRYPWLSERSIDDLMTKARAEMERVISHERRGAPRGREIAAMDAVKAIAYLRRHLEREPQDADAWYALGEALCSIGDTEEGYRALARGRSLR